jgi:hypothetical protein
MTYTTTGLIKRAAYLVATVALLLPVAGTAQEVDFPVCGTED